MSFCAAFGCSNRTSRKSATQKEKTKLSFHIFPKNEPRRKLWVKACRRESWTPSARSVLCSEHFTPESFDRTSHSLIRLKPEAVPTIFPAFPHYLQKTPKVRKPPVFHQKVNHENNLISEAQPEQHNMDAIKEEPGSDQETYETEYYLVDANLEEQFVPIPFPALKTEDMCQEEPRVIIPTLKEEKHNEITTEEHEVCLDRLYSSKEMFLSLPMVKEQMKDEIPTDEHQMCLDRIDLNKQAHGTTSTVIDVGKTEELELDCTGRTDPLLPSEPDGAACKEKWNNLRSVYIRHLKVPPSGSGAKKKKYYLTEAMNFILPYVKAHSTISGEVLDDNVEEQQEDAGTSKETQGDKEDVTHQVSEIEMKTPPLNTNQPSRITGCKRKRQTLNEVDRSFLNFFKERQMAQKDNTAGTRKYFLLSLLDKVNKLSEEQMKAFKRKVLILIDDIMTPTHTSQAEYNLQSYSPVSSSSSQHTSQSQFAPIVYSHLKTPANTAQIFTTQPPSNTEGQDISHIVYN